MNELKQYLQNKASVIFLLLIVVFVGVGLYTNGYLKIADQGKIEDSSVSAEGGECRAKTGSQNCDHVAGIGNVCCAGTPRSRSNCEALSGIAGHCEWFIAGNNTVTGDTETTVSPNSSPPTNVTGSSNRDDGADCTENSQCKNNNCWRPSGLQTLKCVRSASPENYWGLTIAKKWIQSSQVNYSCSTGHTEALVEDWACNESNGVAMRRTDACGRTVSGYCYNNKIYGIIVGTATSSAVELNIGSDLPTCPALDKNNNSKIDFPDFVAFTGEYTKHKKNTELKCQENTEANKCGSVDLNADGRVDFKDFVEFANVYGKESCE